jgi:hypothetical protein
MARTTLNRHAAHELFIYRRRDGGNRGNGGGLGNASGSKGRSRSGPAADAASADARERAAAFLPGTHAGQA